MFWALVIEPNKRYTQVVSKSFHVSMACMDVESADNEITSVMLEVDDEKLILCNLSKNKYIQQPLDLNFQMGDEISFYSKGKATVHLTGYLVLGEDFPGLSSDQESDEEEDDKDDEEEAKEALKMKACKAMKRGLEVQSLKNKKAKLDPAVDEGDSDEDDEDFELDEESTDEEACEEEEQESGSGEEEESEDEEVDMSELKKGKKDAKKTPGKEEKKEAGAADKKNESVNGTPNLSAKKKKLKDGATPKVKAGSPVESLRTPKGDEMQKKTLMGGVAIEDLKIGGGPVAKAGRLVTVYYVGRLKHNNKQFDSTQQGPGFKFRLGSNEVIKGWDLGIAGMKVGGKRKIMCPPNMAYGSKGSPPVIPPNSSLVFEVELKGINKGLGQQ